MDDLMAQALADPTGQLNLLLNSFASEVPRQYEGGLSMAELPE